MSCRYDAEAGYLRADGEPCWERHCLSCGSRHVDQLTCAWCVGQARETLREIGRLCELLPEEVEVKGVQSEAMVLLGPACDVEARGHLEASVAAGRLSADYLEDADDEHHPLLVLGNSQMEWEAELDHESTSKVTVSGALHYLGVNLTDMAQWPHITIADHWAAWVACLGHLRSVLRDTGQEVTGAPCPTCHRHLRLDGEMWVCRECRTTRDQVQYDEMVHEVYLLTADRLHVDDLAEKLGIPARTIRQWASERKGKGARPPLIFPAGRTETGRSLYRVTEVEALRARV